ncbi:MAG: ABC transporter permease [Bacteroidota bacterium]|nr:ABC transporter permease [Bacteroidota bacterium]
MVKYILRKLVYSIFILWGVLTLIFMLFNVLPGDPARMMLGQRADSASIAAIRQDLGLNRPLWLQYTKYINDVSPISFHETINKKSYFYIDTKVYAPCVTLSKIGSHRSVLLKFPYLRRSYQSKKNVSDIIRETLPNTLILAVAAIAFATVLGILLGILAALYKDSWYDRVFLVVSTLGMSLPSFFAAILIGWFFAFVLGPVTGLNLTGNLVVLDDLGQSLHYEWKNLILPTFTLGIRPLSVFIQLTRNSMLEVLSQDYIRTARAKGLSETSVIFKHALKNALNPVITAISGWFASLMAGVVFVEYIFAWKGLGYIIVDALNNYDLPLVLGCVLTISVIFVIINLLVDIIYSLLDPRVRLY